MHYVMVIQCSLLAYFFTLLIQGHPGHAVRQPPTPRFTGNVLEFFDAKDNHEMQAYHIARRFEHTREVFTSRCMSRSDIERMFVEDCALYSNDNHIIPDHKSGNGLMRIASFNVRLWTDVTWKDRFEETWNVITQINPDILVLQEVVLDERTPAMVEKLRELGFHIAHHWQTDQTQTFAVGNYRLTNLIMTRMPVIQASSQNFEGGAMGYVRVEVPCQRGVSLVVYGTHLDVVDTTEMTRALQMQELIVAAQRDRARGKYVIIAGDLNAIDLTAYKVMNSYDVPLHELVTMQYQVYRGGNSDPVPQLVASMWQEAEFVDSFLLIEQQAPLWTSWWGGRTDYILCPPELKRMVHGNYVYYTSVSDHLPIILDLMVN